jgi:membrane-associated progesterone receptor component
VTKEEPHKMLRVGKFQKAIKLYSEELELAQDDLERASLLSNRAYAYLMAKKFKEAAEDATLSLQLKPAYKKSQARLAMAEAVLTQQSEQYSQAADAEGGDDVSLPDITEAQLANFNGTNEMPIYIAVRDVVYDMTDNGGWGFYSPGNAYEVFAGKDATVGLAKMTLKPEECQTNERGLKGEESVVDLNDEDFEVLVDWVKKYDEKYKVVGNLLWDHTLSGATKKQVREHIGTEEPGNDSKPKGGPWASKTPADQISNTSDIDVQEATKQMSELGQGQ